MAFLFVRYIIKTGGTFNMIYASIIIENATTLILACIVIISGFAVDALRDSIRGPKRK